MEQPVESTKDEKAELDPMTVRLLDFVRKKGRSKVASAIGVNPSVFYNYEAGRNKQPAPDILRRLAIEYADFDPLYILTGQTKVVLGSVESSTKNESLGAENTLLRDQIADLKKSNSFLQSVVAKQMSVELEIKTESAIGHTLGTQTELNLKCPRRADRPMIFHDINDLRPMTRVWPAKFRLSGPKQ